MRYVFLPLIFIILVRSISLSQLMISPEKVVNNAEHYNKKFIQVSGKISGLEEFANLSGEQSIKFMLIGSEGSYVNVILSSPWPYWLKENLSVVVTGTYFYNERVKIAKTEISLFENTIIHASIREYRGDVLDILQQLIK